MQVLVYIFIVLAGLCVGVAAYFGLTFTPIEAATTAFVFIALAVVALERTLRRRAEARLERAIGELSRLLATHAQAGGVINQRLNALIEENPRGRLEAVEADISVLGTVVRQVAESLAELEHTVQAAAHQGRGLRPIAPASPSTLRRAGEAEDDRFDGTDVPFGEDTGPEALPRLSPEEIEQALNDNRLAIHIQPVLALPQRKPVGYDIVPRLSLPDGDFVDIGDILPRRGADNLWRRIERQALEEAVTIARRSRTAGQPTTLYVPIGRPMLMDAPTIERIVSLLEANRAVTPNLVLVIGESDWNTMPAGEKSALAAFTGKGLALALDDLSSLRLDFALLAAAGVQSVRVDATRFVGAPHDFTDFHVSDVTSYIKRFDIDLIVTGVRSEEQVLMLLEDGIVLVQGAHLAAAGPVRADLAGGAAGLPRLARRAEG